MKKLLPLLAIAAGAVATAQSPLTTLFASNNSGAAGWTMYFDVTLNVPLTFTQFDINNISGAVAGSISVYYTTSATTYVGNDTNVGAWTLGGTGSCTGAATNVPTPCVISPFTLPVGSYGMAVVHTGVGPAYTNGNGTSVPGSGTNQTYSTAELTLRAGASAGGGLGTAICCTPRVIDCNIYYNVNGGGTVATRSPYGSGCVARFGSFYENFATGAAFDLSNSGMTLLPSAGGYTAIPGIGTFQAPSGTATAVAVGDDVEQTVALSSSFPYPGGSTSALTVCSNGFVSVATGNGTGFSPVVSTMLAFPQTAWGGWHDYYPLGGVSGNVMFEQIGAIAYVTWNNVVDYGGTIANTWQLQFDTASGIVNYVWQTMSLSGNTQLVFYSPAGPSNDPGNRDISATLPGSFVIASPEINPVTLAASARPLVSTSINLNTSNITPTAPFGAVLLSLTQFNPGLDLTGIGMPTCRQYTGGEVTLIFLPLGSPTVSTPFNVPNYPGFHVFCQSVVYDPAAGLTALGAVASNGLDLGIGNL
jgi:hypothetical protein